MQRKDGFLKKVKYSTLAKNTFLFNENYRNLAMLIEINFCNMESI